MSARFQLQIDSGLCDEHALKKLDGPTLKKILHCPPPLSDSDIMIFVTELQILVYSYSSRWQLGLAM